MEPIVDVVIEDARWQGLDTLCEAAARATFRELGMGMQGFTLCVMGCDDARIAALEQKLSEMREAVSMLREPVARLLEMHPDDLEAE